jgi:hypothetical protein
MLLTPAAMYLIRITITAIMIYASETFVANPKAGQFAFAFALLSFRLISIQYEEQT